MGETKLPVGVSVLLIDRDSVLLGKRINNTAAGLWSTPGGRVEEGERIVETAARELLEETGLALPSSAFTVCTYREHFRYGNHYIMFYVWARCPEGLSRLIENKEPDKCEGWIWWSRERIYNIKEEETTEPFEILLDIMNFKNRT